MSYAVADPSDIEAVRDGRVRRVRQALGITAFGVNQFHLPPGGQGSEHDESASGQEELYLVLDGNGVMAVDGEAGAPSPPLCLRPAGHDAPASRRRQGSSLYVCVGSPPGRAYEPRS